MQNEEETENVVLKDGFRVGDFFVSFPSGEFVHEDKNGEIYVDVEIYKIDRDRIYKTKDQITPEIEQAIQEELNRLLTEGLELLRDSGDDNVKN